MTGLDPRVRVVTAPAGSGKTTVLVARWLRELRTTTIDRVVAITFTRRAAAELTFRLADVLRAVVDGSLATRWELQHYVEHTPDPGRAREALAALDAAPVGTVDRFVAALLREHALDARLPLVRGGSAWIDLPSPSVSVDAAAAYRAAARARLERLDEPARIVLAEMLLGEAEDDVATLASAAIPALWRDEVILSSPGAAELVRETAARGYDAAVRRLGLVASPEVIERLEAEREDLEAWTPAALDRADRVRRALAVLAVDTRDEALRGMAEVGALGWDEALAAATALCHDAPASLTGRFDALLVDELQDTNPAQLALYRAFASMPRPGEPIRAFFVGDARQSIYRFRHADPDGWRALVDEAARDGVLGELTVNRRSSRLLVSAQRRLFGALAARGEHGVDPLVGVEAKRSALAGVLGAPWPEPLVMVDVPEARGGELDVTVLGAFAARLRARWQTHPDEDAAVLARGWKAADGAVRTLRGLGVRAQLAVDRELLASRAAGDLRLFLRALRDPTDEIARLGVLKHPSVGVSDRGTAFLARGDLDLGRLDARLALLDPADRARLLAVLPPLREAASSLGRMATARVLERLVARLGWRPLVAAGPEGAVGVAQLDVLLDVVREAEAERVDPSRALDALTLDPDRLDDLPPVRMFGGPDVVMVTTIHSAKGLEWDHVALLGVGRASDGGKRRGQVLQLSTPRGTPVLGVRLDPTGALSPRRDPIALIGAALGEAEAREEGERLFYVGLTRARRSVTFGLGKPSRAGGTLADAIRAVVHEAVGNGTAGQGAAGQGVVGGVDAEEIRKAVRIVSPAEVAGVASAAGGLGERRWTREVRAPRPTWATATGWTVVAPSRLDAPAELHASWARRARTVTGLAAPPWPARPLGDAELGHLVHGWLEVTRLADPGRAVLLEAARAYLRDAPVVVAEAEHAAVADWLVATTFAVRSLPGLVDLLHPRHHGTSRRAPFGGSIRLQERAAFELPLLGRVDGAGQLVVGRADLVIDRADGTTVLVDFKAGRSAGTAEHVAQLDAYRRLLEASGRRVVECGVLATRAPAWIRYAMEVPDRG